jgi:hypothetical protein
LHIVTCDAPYPNLYYRDKSKPGWETNRATRPVILDELKGAIRQGQMGIMDKELILECLSFVRTARKPDGEADAGAYDDLVMANAGAWRLRNLSRPPVEFKFRELLP